MRGRACVFTRGANGAWTRTRLPLPDNLATTVTDADVHGNDAFLNVDRLPDAEQLWLADAHAASIDVVKSLRAQFDASRDVVEQHEATSKDGTKIPYFVVHRARHEAVDGPNPTLLYAYGGFQVSETPYYSATVGKLWLERGGVFVLANIRGGGEFGPAWHEAGLKTNRQRDLRRLRRGRART